MPPGLETKTGNVPATSMTAAGTVAVSCVLLTTVVASWVVPFHVTTVVEGDPCP